MDEEVLGIVSPTEGKGKVRLGGTIKRYALIFTPTRMVAAKLAGFLAILAGGLGDAGDVFARWRSVKTRDLAGMSIEDILRSNKDNYALKYSDIIKVEMVKPRFLG